MLRTQRHAGAVLPEARHRLVSLGARSRAAARHSPRQQQLRLQLALGWGDDGPCGVPSLWVGAGKDVAGVSLSLQIICCVTLPGVLQHHRCLRCSWGCSSRILREKEIACMVRRGGVCVTEHPNPAEALLGGEALKSPAPSQLSQLWPPPSPGRGTPACACQWDLKHPWEQPQRKQRCPGEMPA